LYKKALIGELKNVIGVDPETPSQITKNPDLIIDTGKQNDNQSFKNNSDPNIG